MYSIYELKRSGNDDIVEPYHRIRLSKLIKSTETNQQNQIISV